MMRRGDLAHYPPGDVLRAAAAERLTGGIEFDGGAPVCVYLDEGEVYLAAPTDAQVALTVDDELGDVAYETARRADESRLRAASVSVVASLLDRQDGWYFFHALTDHPARGFWAWPVESLLAEAAAGGDLPPPGRAAPGRASTAVDGRPPSLVADEDVGGPEPETAIAVEDPAAAAVAAPEEGTLGWRLNPTPPTEVIDATTWSVLVAMAGSTSETQIVARLGGSMEQAHATVGKATRSGILVAAGDGVPNEVLGGRIRRLRR